MLQGAGGIGFYDNKTGRYSTQATRQLLQGGIDAHVSPAVGCIGNGRIQRL